MPSAKPSQSTLRTPPEVLAGRTLRMMRNTHGVNLRDMAALVGISAGHLSRVESGQRPASPGLVDRICDALAALPTEKESA